MCVCAMFGTWDEWYMVIDPTKGILCVGMLTPIIGLITIPLAKISHMFWPRHTRCRSSRSWTYFKTNPINQFRLLEEATKGNRFHFGVTKVALLFAHCLPPTAHHTCAQHGKSRQQKTIAEYSRMWIWVPLNKKNSLHKFQCKRCNTNSWAIDAIVKAFVKLLKWFQVI